MLPAMVIRYNMGWYEMMLIDVPLFMGATLSVCSFYSVSQREIFGEAWLRRLKYLPAVLSMGIGLSVNNAKAVLEAVFGQESPFTRTPKYRVETAGDNWKLRRYRGDVTLIPYVEIGLGIYCVVMASYAAVNGIFGTLPFILLFLMGYLYAASMSLFQNMERPTLVSEALAEE